MTPLPSPDTETALQLANDIAQACFRDMLDGHCQADPNDPRTLAYVQAERDQDDVLRTLWAAALADGDHAFVTEAVR